MRTALAVTWRKSSRSMNQGACVEVAFVGDDRVMLRDSKDPAGSVLVVDRRRWAGFLAGLSA